MRHIKELSNRNKIISESTYKSVFRPYDTMAYTIKFVFSGVENCNINHRTVSIFPDSFVMLNAGTNYKSVIDSITPVSTLSVSFDPSFVEDFNSLCQLDHEQLLDGNQTVQTPVFIETLYPFMGDMKYNILHLKSQLDKGADNEMLMNEYLHHCLINYYKIYQHEVLQKVGRLRFIRTKTREEVLRRLVLAREYINSNFNKNILLEDISAYCFLSVNHLLRTFKEAYGTSPYQHLIQLRINRAKDLLKTSDYPLSEIVCLIGFENTSSFIRLFKQATGMTPTKYRKQHERMFYSVA